MSTKKNKGKGKDKGKDKDKGMDHNLQKGQPVVYIGETETFPTGEMLTKDVTSGYVVGFGEEPNIIHVRFSSVAHPVQCVPRDLRVDSKHQWVDISNTQLASIQRSLDAREKELEERERSVKQAEQLIVSEKERLEKQKEKLNVLVFQFAKLHKQCIVCNADTNSVCQGCKTFHFCSTQCQEQGWPAHKAICKEVKRIRLAHKEKKNAGKAAAAEAAEKEEAEAVAEKEEKEEAETTISL